MHFAQKMASILSKQYKFREDDDEYMKYPENWHLVIGAPYIAPNPVYQSVYLEAKCSRSFEQDIL